MIHAVIVVARLTPAKSASGDSSGMARAACPDEDGRRASGMLIRIVAIPNTA